MGTPTTASPMREQQPVTTEEQSFAEIPDSTPDESEPMPDEAVEDVSVSQMESQGTESPKQTKDVADLSQKSEDVPKEQEKDEVPQNVEMMNKTGVEMDTISKGVADHIKEQLVSEEKSKKENSDVTFANANAKKEEDRKVAELDERSDKLADP